MQLSKIVYYLNLIDSMSVKDEVVEASRKLSEILHVVTNHEVQSPAHTKELTEVYTTTNNCLDRFQHVLDDIKSYLRTKILEDEKEYLRESTRRFVEEKPFESTEYVLNRTLPIDDQSNIELRSILKNLADWRVPGMIISPGTETFVDDLVALDPLYLVDVHSELLAPAINKFSIEYQRRLRKYVIDEGSSKSLLKDLPDNQFGFVFSYNFMNYRPIEIILRYLTEINSKLRPGGNFIMTYNNCDRGHGVALFENYLMMYTPLQMIKSHAESLGLIMLREHTGLGNLSWVQFQKPGEITSLRGGQALAKIVAIEK